jgi:hypothetical protein
MKWLPAAIKISVSTIMGVRHVYIPARERLLSSVEEGMSRLQDNDLRTFFHAFARAQVQEMSAEELQVRATHHNANSFWALG